MRDLVKTIWSLERDLVSPGYDLALLRISEMFPEMVINSYASGGTASTWMIPDRWQIKDACLKDSKGRVIFSYQDHPLHVVRYSLPVDRKVKRSELFNHLHTLPDAIPYVFKFYDRDWGLCCTQETKESLTDKHYWVEIATSEESGSMNVGELYIEGSRPETFILTAHLDHPCQANDNLSGVAVALSLAKYLMNKKTLYSYCIVLGPETIGSIAWLSENRQAIPLMIGGLNFELVGHGAPLVLQLPFDAEHQTARIARSLTSQTVDYRKGPGSDERQYNAPGVRVPMMQLSRSSLRVGNHYNGYHSNRDTFDMLDWDKIDEAVDAGKAIVDALEENSYIQNKFIGELFASRYGLFPDYQEDPLSHQEFFEVTDRFDGKMSIADIALDIDVPFSVVLKIAQSLEGFDLVRRSLKPASQKTEQAQKTKLGQGRIR